MATTAIEIIPIPALDDNYIWLLHNKLEAIIVDPGDAQVVESKLRQLNLKLAAILITHHHYDHTDGVERLCQKFNPTVYAPSYRQYPFKHTTVSDGDCIHINALDLDFDVQWLPGHTLDHVTYQTEHHLFCGDILFAAGCGRLREGTPKQMLDALNRIKSMPPQTKIYCGHEYTAHNINFALTLEPGNKALQDRKIDVATKRAQQLPTLPTTLALELATNPFLRCGESEIIGNLHSRGLDELSIFTAIREKRNHY